MLVLARAGKLESKGVIQVDVAYHVRQIEEYRPHCLDV
jgi:hypothetical protein